MTWMSKARALRANDVAHHVTDGVPACATERAQHARLWAELEAGGDDKVREWTPLRERDHLCAVCRAMHKMICTCPRCAPMLATLPRREEIYDALVARGEKDPAVVQWGDRMIVGRWVSIGRLLAREDVPGYSYVHRSEKRAIEVIGEGSTWRDAAAAAGVALAPMPGRARSRAEDAPGGASTNGTTNGASGAPKPAAGKPGGGA